MTAQWACVLPLVLLTWACRGSQRALPAQTGPAMPAVAVAYAHQRWTTSPQVTACQLAGMAARSSVGLLMMLQGAAMDPRDLTGLFGMQSHTCCAIGAFQPMHCRFAWQ